MTLPPISHSWWRIEHWVRSHEEDMQEAPPPATSQDITQAEQLLGLSLPAEIRELLTCHNGSGPFLLPPGFHILSTSEIAEQWKLNTTASAQDPYSPFLPTYAPFAADGSGTVLYLDTGSPQDPRIHERDREGEAPSITPHPMWNSITSLMYHTAEALESGDVLDRYLRPVDTDFMEWRFADDEAVEEAPRRLGKFGRLIED
ncbi:SMI1/KNR4 family protein [Streptomyces synnematoformans]|uniref:Knr4/Smi1-like domain-containing protein n=1 Tax=Streptomyces synnematoformans TaxID=415721 RepID=A0ABN2YRH6_9ACTN